MQKHFLLPKSRTALTRHGVGDTGAALARSAASVSGAGRVSLFDLWRDATEAFVAHAASFLLVGVIGFAFVPLIGPMLAVIALPLTRAAIMHIALNKNIRAMQLRQMPALLATAWIYAFVITLGQTAVAVPLRAWDINLDFAEQRSATWEGAVETMSLRSLDALLLMPDSPIKGWLPTWRNWAYSELMYQSGDAYKQHLIDEYGTAVVNFSISTINAQTKKLGLNPIELEVLFAGSIALLFGAEALFIFRSVLNERPSQMFALSLRHFSRVAGHVWFLRLVIVGLKAMFVFAPLILVDEFRYLAYRLNWFDSPVQVAILSVCLLVINAVCMTFEAVYSARLFAALSGDLVVYPSKNVALSQGRT